jgi:hypothetical protein
MACGIVAVSCGRILCGNEVLGEFRSPDGKYIATVFERNCGATTPYVRVVSLRRAESSFDPESTGDWVFTLKHQPSIEVKWEDSTHLFITHGRNDDSPTRRNDWNEVRISYPALSP